MHRFSLNQALMAKDTFSKDCFFGCFNLDCSFIEPQSPLSISVDSVAIIFLILLWIGALKFYYKTRQHVTKWYNQGLRDKTSSLYTAGRLTKSFLSISGKQSSLLKPADLLNQVKSKSETLFLLT